MARLGERPNLTPCYHALFTITLLILQLHRLDSFLIHSFKGKGANQPPNQLIRQTKQSYTKVSSKERAVDDVCNWVTEDLSIDTSSIEVRESPGRGFGLYAREDIVPGSFVLKIPMEHCIYPEMVLKDDEMGEAAKKYLDQFLEAGDIWKWERDLQNLLPAYLVKELAKKEKSKFYPYLAALPWEESKRYVLNWNYDELCLLKGSTILQSVYYLRGESQLGIYMFEEVLPDYVKEYFGSDFERVCKAAFFLANSRAACYKWEEEEKERLGIELALNDTLVMAPMFDFLNHRRISPSCWFGGYDFEDESGMGVITKRPIKKDEELTVCYGKKSNLNLFLVYDHVEEDPLCWIAKVPMTVHQLDPLHELKMEILTRNGFTKDGRPEMEVRLKKRSAFLDLDDAHLAHLRIIAMSDEKRLREEGDKLLQAWVKVKEDKEKPKEDDAGPVLPTEQKMALSASDLEDEEDEEYDYKDTFYDIPRSEQKDVLYTISRLCSEMLSEFPETFEEVNYEVVDPERAAIAKKLVDTEKAVLQSYIITKDNEDEIFDESLGVGF